MSPRALSFRFALFLAPVFASIGAFLPFWPLWLEGRGLSAAEIGLLLALGSWLKVAANPVVAHLFDRAGWGKGAVVLLIVMSLATFAAFIPAEGFLWILAVHLLVTLCFPVILPMTESLTMQAVYKHSLDYGRIRLWGSLAFIAASLATGWLLAGGGAEWVLWVILIALLLALFAAAGLPVRILSGGPGDAGEDASLKHLLRLFIRWETLGVLGAAALSQASHAAYYGFSSLAWQAAGISETTIGILWAEGVVAEILFFAVSRRLIDRMPPTRLLAIAGLLGTLRWTVTGLSTDLVVLAGVQVLHAATFAATHLASMHFIARTTPPRLAATMQSVNAALSGGLAMGGAMLLAGTLYEQAASLAFFAMAGLTFAAAMLAYFVPKMRSPASPRPGTI